MFNCVLVSENNQSFGTKVKSLKDQRIWTGGIVVMVSDCISHTALYFFNFAALFQYEMCIGP